MRYLGEAIANQQYDLMEQMWDKVGRAMWKHSNFHEGDSRFIRLNQNTQDRLRLDDW